MRPGWASSPAEFKRCIRAVIPVYKKEKKEKAHVCVNILWIIMGILTGNLHYLVPSSVEKF